MEKQLNTKGKVLTGVIVGVLLILLALVTTVPALAASTANITLSYTSAFFDFTITTNGVHDLGSITANTTYWFLGGNTTAPGFPLASDNCGWSISNNSSATADFYVKGESFTNHTLSADATNGADTLGMKAADNNTANEASMVVVAPSAGNGNVLGDDIAAYCNFDFEIKLLTPTSSSVSDNQSGDVQITAITAS